MDERRQPSISLRDSWVSDSESELLRSRTMSNHLATRWDTLWSA